MAPSVLSMAIAELILHINVMFVGRLNAEEKLAGIGLANSIVCSVPLALTYGLSGVLETLVSQAYGQKQYKLCGVYLNRQLSLISLFYIPIGALMYNSEPILVSVFGQDPEASYYCQLMLRSIIPSTFLECLFETFQLYFISMQKSYIPMIIQGILLPIHYCFCELFVN